MDQNFIEDILAPMNSLLFVFDEGPQDSYHFSEIQKVKARNDEYFAFGEVSHGIIMDQLAQISENDLEEPNPHQSNAKYMRADNTIFKTGLGQYRKSLIDEVRSDPRIGWVQDEIKKMYRGRKNLSIFPKLNIMVRQLGISHQILLRWQRRSRNLLEKKLALVAQGRYVRSRYDELERSIAAMNFSMKEPLFEVGFQTYWGNFKQASRFARSREQVLSFRQYFQSLLKENDFHPQIGQVTSRKKSDETEHEGAGLL